MNRTCGRDGCNQPVEPFAGGYCSSECRHLQLRYEVLQFDAMLDGREPPDMDELLDKRQRAKRWTPDTMAEYLEQVTA